MLGLPVVWRRLSGQPRARRPVGPFRYATLGCWTVSRTLGWGRICPPVIRCQSQNQWLNDRLLVHLVQPDQREQHCAAICKAEPSAASRLLVRQQLGDCDVLKLWKCLTIDSPGACNNRRDPIASRTPFQKRTGESRRRASYSTTMSLPDTDTVPRPRGQTFVSILNVAPSPGIFAKICWGPRTICPFSTS